MQKCTFFFVLTLALPGYLQQPSSDVRLCLDSTTCTTVIPNNTILHPGNISNAGLLCVSSLDENGIGNWFYPSGEQIINQQSSVFSSLQRIRHVGLFRGGAAFTSAAEGVYTCRIPDGSRVQQTLYVGIYQTSSYMNSGGPVLETPVGFHLLTPLSSQPPSFILNCTSTQSPPTTVTWTRNGETLNSRSPEYSISQVLRNATSTMYNNLLTVRGSQEGEYSCTVSNDRGALSANVSVVAPSGRPVNVTAEAIGNNQVRVTWVPAANVRGYQLVYTTNTSADMNSVNVEDPTAVEHTLRNFTAGVRYTIQVVAYANLPSEASDPVSIELRLPAVPTDVQATMVSSTSIRVSWREPLGGEVVTGFEVSYTPVNSCPGTPGGRRMVEGRTITQFTLTGLQPFTNYSIYVRANASQGLGPASMPAVFEMTQADAPTGSPQNVSVSVTGTTIVVRWNPPACRHKNGDTLSYVVRYGPSAGSSSEMETTALFYRLTELTTFTEYSVQVAARHPTAGTGPFSNPVTAMIIGRPSEVTSPVATPDIVSVLLSWEPPINGRGTIIQYMVSHGLADSQNLIASRVLSGNTTSYRVMQLIPETAYRFAVTPYTSSGEGPPQRLTGTTQSIGQVQGVVVRSLNSGARNVSWQRLSSQDIVYYKVYFSGGSDRFSGRSSWGVVEGGGQFEVAAVVIVNGREVEGERSTPAGAVGSVMIAIIAGAAGGGLIVIILVVVTILFVCLVWRRGRSGKFNVAKNHHELKRRSTPLPLPSFENDTVPSAKPVIDVCPKDMMALEGEQVVFDPKFHGSPPPSIAWYHNGCMVVSDYSIKLSESGKLTILCAEPCHNGKYRFTVSNSAGSVQGQVTLAVCSENGENPLLETVKSCPVEISKFGVHVAELHASNNQGFRKQYHSLNSGESGRSVIISNHAVNKQYNRFLNITPYDENRIRLKPLNDVPDCRHDYINASYIDGYYIQKKFVSTQGPLSNTVIDFWRLVWQLRPPSIVMVTNLREGSRAKCEQYWPELGTQEYGPFKVTLTDQQVFADYTIRQLFVSMMGRSQTPLKVVQYQFTAWPDHGVPEYVTPMLSFHRRVVSEHKCVRGPMLVHCSAGVGRTGTFITIDYALQQAQEEGKVDIVSIITKLRKQRMKMVQTLDQYIFIHEAVLEATMCGNTQVPAPELHSAIEVLSKRDPKSGKTGFEKQFQVLTQVTPSPKEAPCPTALQYTDRNRSTNYLPTDRWRVVLKAEHPDYINASFANGYKQKKAFILTQGPMNATCRDFWKMVYERNCGAIVMLSAIVENEEEVCYRYWPMNGMEQYGEFTVSNLEQTMHDGFMERIFSVTDSKSGQAHRVSHFHLLNWGPNCKIDNPSNIITVISCVMQTQRRNGNTPIVVHCSDMVSRSAIFCATMTTIEGCKTESMADVFQVVKALRVQRPGAVMTVEQYRFIHELVLQFLDNYSNYSNFK